MSPNPDCPNCSAPLPTATPCCPACELPLTGPVAAELWVSDQQMAALQRRRSLLLQTLRAGITEAGAASTPSGPPSNQLD